MADQELIDYFTRERDRHYETARRAIAAVTADLAQALADLYGDQPFVRTMPGGGMALNPQDWLKAEEALIRYWDAAGVVAELERDGGQQDA